MSIVCVDADSVIEFIRSFGVSRDSFQSSNTSPLKEAAATLRQRAAESKEIENSILLKFGVKTLEELQAKIDKIAENFSSFQSAAIRNSLSDLDSGEGPSLTPKQLNDALIDYLLQTSEGQEVINMITEEAGQEVEEAAIKKIGDILSAGVEGARSSERGINRSYFDVYVRDFAQYIKSRKKAAVFSRQYKKDLKVMIGLIDKDAEANSTWYIRGELEKEGNKPNLSFYPYFGLSEEEKAEASKDMATWANFTKNLCSLVPQYGPYVEIALQKFTPSDFFQYDMNGVVGILGEVQAMAMLLALLPNDSAACFRAAGNLKNELAGNAKLGTDILIDELYGIQIKNYRGYPATGGAKGYRLTRDLTASELISRLTSSQKDDLGSYLAITSYNLPFKDVQYLKRMGWYDAVYQKSLKQYESYFNSLKAKGGSVFSTIKALIAADVDKFWTFTELYWATMEETDDALLGGYNNVFWFFGGQTLVASSQIFNLLAARIEQLSAKLGGKDKAVLDNFYVTFSDANSIFWRPTEKEGDDLRGPDISADTILSHINVHLSLNIYLEDIKNFGGL